MAKIFKVRVPAGIDIVEVIDSLKKLPNVLFAEPNFHDYRSQGFPDDPHYQNGDQWGLYNYGQNGGTNRADIHASEAWKITTGSNVLIGVIDDGVDAGHEDLLGKVGGDAGVYGGSANWVFGHGTHVSGIAAAFGNNSKGIAGVNWAATINSQRIENGSDQDFYNGIMDAVYTGSKVLNNSWGGYSYSTTVRIAFANAYKMNVVSVAAMGNDNTSNILYPAGYGLGIIAVGATDRNDVRSIWGSNGSNYGNHIDVTAPGTSIWSSIPYTNQYASWNGTSMATPFVSGIASLLKGYNPNLYNDDIEHIIQLSADKVAGMNGQNYTTEYGYGRVNARNALDFLRSPYVLQQSSTTGGTDVWQSDFYTTTIYGAPGLADAVYLVKRHEIQKSVNFSPMTNHSAWGRGVATNGWSSESPNYAMGWCDIVPGTLTVTSVTLRTYVYEVYTVWMNWMGWYPTDPSNVTFAYTVHGIPQPPLSVSISGPDYLTFKELGTWTAYPTGGSGNYSYQWYISFNNGSSWTAQGTAQSQSYRMGLSDFIIRCDVHDNGTGENASDRMTVYYSNGKPLPIANNDGKEKLQAIPTDYSIGSYPNPFNPAAVINYQLPVDGVVRLTIFDVLGREVKTIVNETKTAGYYKAAFDGSQLPSGIYLARISVIPNQGKTFVQTIKMVLTK